MDHASRITDDESNRFQLGVDIRASQLQKALASNWLTSTGQFHGRSMISTMVLKPQPSADWCPFTQKRG